MRNCYQLTLTASPDGALRTAYLRLKSTKVLRTLELIEDTLLADFDYRGDLVGLEILAPVRISDLTKPVDKARRANLARFARKVLPEDLRAA